MKMKKEHYAFMKQELETVLKDKAPLTVIEADYQSQGATPGCFRRDVIYMAKLSKWVCSELYPYLEDKHIDTALKSIMQEMGCNWAAGQKPKARRAKGDKMPLKMKKVKYIVKNGLYGDKEVTGYENRGLVTYKQGKKWVIAHAASGCTIEKPQDTMGGAMEIMKRLHDFGVPWDLPWGAELRSKVGLYRKEIRRAFIKPQQEPE